MKNDFDNQPFGLSSRKQEAAGGQALVIITAAFAATNFVLMLTVFFIATNIQHRRVPLAPPSHTLLLLFYAAGLLFLLAAVLRPQFRTLSAASLPQKEFQQQVIVAVGVANLSQYLGVVWVLLGGAFLLSIPFFAGPALVNLLFIQMRVRPLDLEGNSLSRF